MKARLAEALKMLVMWDDQLKFCREHAPVEDGGGCVNCPYDLAKTCDIVSTEYVLELVADAARDFFKEE